MTSAEEHMVHMDWISVLDHPGLLDPPANTGDAATLWHELRIGLDWILNMDPALMACSIELAKVELHVY